MLEPIVVVTIILVAGAMAFARAWAQGWLRHDTEG
jgi:hypothetical protein